MLTAEQSLFLAALYAHVAIWLHREAIERHLADAELAVRIVGSHAQA